MMRLGQLGLGALTLPGLLHAEQNAAASPEHEAGPNHASTCFSGADRRSKTCGT